MLRTPKARSFQGWLDSAKFFMMYAHGLEAINKISPINISRNTTLRPLNVKFWNRLKPLSVENKESMFDED